jgi:hypothetical protein
VLVYNDVGSLAELTNEFFTNGNLTVVARHTMRSEFGSGGETFITVSHSDADADGLTDFRSEDLPTYVVVNDGVRLLAQWYFQRSN